MTSLEQPVHRPRGHDPTSRRRTFSMALALAVLLTTLVLPPSSHAWEQKYKENDWMHAGGIDLSAFNSGLTFNYVSFGSNPPPYMRLTLCDASYQCYAYTESETSFADYRDISYGRAKCNAPSFNSWSLWVNYCLTHNN
jgi:hypothetical protein